MIWDFQTANLTAGLLREPQLNKGSSTSHSTSLHQRPYQQCIAAEAPGNNLPSSWPFFWFHALGARAGFSKDGKSGCWECSTKAGPCLLKGLLQTALTCSLLRQMRCLWRDRAAQIKKKRFCLLCCNTWGQSGLASSFIINDILRAFSIQQTHAHQTAQKSLPSISSHYLHWELWDHVEDKVISSTTHRLSFINTLWSSSSVWSNTYASEESNIAGLC